MYEHFSACFNARDWDAVTEMLADGIHNDDRRQVVNAGVRHGRDATIASMRATVEFGVSATTKIVIATRGERLTLCRERFAVQEQRSDAFGAEVLGIVEIDANERIVTRVAFDLNDIDAAFAELDARYIAGEAAPYRDAWSVIAAGYAALNRHEVPASASDYVNIDHRLRATIEADGLGKNLRAAWDLTPDAKGYIESVHRLSELGAVVIHTARGTSREGMDAEWRGVHLLTLEASMVNRCEVFDESDLDTALARFEDLQPQAPRLENATSRVYEHYKTCFAERDWAAMEEILAEDISTDDRRRVVNAGVLQGRDVVLADTGALAEVGANITSAVIATREEHLLLCRVRFWGQDQRPQEFIGESLSIVETDVDDRITAGIVFDVDDFDAAIAELDARYLAGEAAANANTWSVIAAAHARFNRQELPATTPDPVYIDHRPVVSIEGGDLAASLRAVWDITPASSVYIEAVHRLDELGAVATQVLRGTSQAGLDAEWRMIEIFTVEGEVLSRVEVFEEADLDTALARFAELHSQPPRPENAVGRILERYQACFSAREWTAMSELLADDIVLDDRRRVVNAGVQRGREVHIADLRAAVEVGADHIFERRCGSRGAPCPRPCPCLQPRRSARRGRRRVARRRRDRLRRADRGMRLVRPRRHRRRLRRA